MKSADFKVNRADFGIWGRLWGTEGNSKVEGADFEVKKQIVGPGADFGAKKGDYLFIPKTFVCSSTELKDICSTW